mmetsp:Transcript_38777/g.76849  ORF Transcript_38777/g.76849 Transcript_38777/m.76849 type:complete len:248 (-) Transcript_38777:94-837(-)|eukprot:CAMPEP_0172805982 /NCGR_PEP_ID=MMETSP1075-20121228/6047_1 /TAXON_ID=2916 /ORGANISM="Ceratium fusus, Strain PA161109" /LENGTH=247 /DNA_ID=CAMNT_0013644695 /DNA_START=50 /DNA_END=793 /DNA_ORIENTATION=+
MMALALVALLASLSQASAALTKVLPLGDSITFGCGDGCNNMGCGDQCAVLRPSCQAGWRAELWRKLSPGSNTSGEWDFVGSEHNGPDDIDRDHDGFPSWRVEDVMTVSSKWLPLKPDVILLHLGTNNLGVGFQSANAALGHMSTMLDTIFKELPNVRLLLATLIGSTNYYGGGKHAAYNAGLKRLATVLGSAGRRVEIVDMATESGLGEKCDTGKCCMGGVHPNADGYRAMADVWYAHLTGKSEIIV